MDLADKARILLDSIGVNDTPHLEQLNGGGNNRVFRLDAGGKQYILKLYFKHPEDMRDRLVSEYGFAKFAWEQGITCVPEPCACSNEHSMGLYKYIEGEAFSREDVNDDAIEQAAGFLRKLNESKFAPGARALAAGSEACFSVMQHLDTVEKRVSRLGGILPECDSDREALALARGKLKSAFLGVKEKALSDSKAFNISVDDEIPYEERIISPSDFGFHNAIKAGDGKIHFLDFEYAGWDDPAKTMCDFFSQVAVPVPIRYFGRIINSLEGLVPDINKTETRAQLLLPLYRIKWICIILNHFLPHEMERKSFARRSSLNSRLEQLKKAQSLLHSLVQPD